MFEKIKINAELNLYGAERRLVLAVDGVAWQSIQELRAEGLFQLFSEPSRVISTFPSTTGPAMVQLLAANPTHGYESLYFDPERRALGGGISKYIGRRKEDPVKRGYNHLLDYEEPLPFEFLVYVVPDLIWEGDFGLFFEKFDKGNTRLFVAFLKSTDGITHIGSRGRLFPALRELDRRLTDLYLRHKGKLEIVVYSDHGNYMEGCQRVMLERHLLRAGFKMENKLRRDNSVVAPAFGLCSYAALYTEERNLNEIAGMLRKVQGVDFSVYHEPGEEKIAVVGARGVATVEYDQARHAFRYTAQTEDPLQLAGVIKDLQSQGLMDSDGFARDQDWLTATRGGFYPDILARLRDSLSQVLVNYPANMLVSLEDGYYWGSTAFEIVGYLAATHGNATSSCSYAFLMSSHRQPPPYMRATEASNFLKN